MACVNPDGTLTDSARALLKNIGTPSTPEEISKKVGQPLFKVRSSLREMVEAGFISEEEDKYVITENGKTKI